MPSSVHHPRYVALQRHLKKTREDAGLTQTDLASVLKVGQSYVSKIERGERYMDVIFYLDWCRAWLKPPQAASTAGADCYHCRRLDEEGRPDIELRFKSGSPLLIECKNVLRVTASGGIPRVDFQRTRASKSDPCSRYYRPDDFHILAACLHAVTEDWEYRFVPTIKLPGHHKCPGRIQSNLRVDAMWHQDPTAAFRALM